MSSRGAAASPARSHTRTVPSWPPLTAVRPSAPTATATPFTQPVWPVSSRGAVASPARSPTCTAAPGRRRSPQNPYALHPHVSFTQPPWPVSSSGAPVPARSHTRTVPSWAPLTAVRPSALTATARTQLLWPVRVCRSTWPGCARVGRIGHSQAACGHARAAACSRASSGSHRPIVRPASWVGSWSGSAARTCADSRIVACTRASPGWSGTVV